MQAPACDSIFDVVFWFIDRALNDNEHIQAQKVHRLLFLAQAYYGVLHRRKLLPAVFVAIDLGPIEPNVFRIFSSSERPYVERLMVPEQVEEFLDGLWRRFGHHSTDYLTRLVKSHAPYREAIARGPRTEITLDRMVKFYGKPRSEVQARVAGVVAPDRVETPKVLRTQTGRAVAIRTWAPAPAPADAPVVIKARPVPKGDDRGTPVKPTRPGGAKAAPERLAQLARAAKTAQAARTARRLPTDSPAPEPVSSRLGLAARLELEMEVIPAAAMPSSEPSSPVPVGFPDPAAAPDPVAAPRSSLPVPVSRPPTAAPPPRPVEDGAAARAVADTVADAARQKAMVAAVLDRIGAGPSRFSFPGPTRTPTKR